MRIIIFCLAAFLLGCSEAPEPAQAQSANVVAFTHVDVIPMDTERVLADQTVVIRGDRIAEVGPAASVVVPEGAQTVDGHGLYLMPGLAEMHGHVPPPSDPQTYIDAVLYLYVANGITTVRGMLGHDGQLELRRRANAGEIVAPTLYLAGPSFNGNSINSPAEAEAKVRQQKAEGWDLLKVHPGLTLAEYDAMAETAREVGIRFGGHVPDDVGFAHAIEQGQETFDHLDGYIAFMQAGSTPVSDLRVTEAVQMTLDAGAWVVPTMILWEVLYGVADLETVSTLPELRYMPPAMTQSWIDTHRRRVNDPGLDREASRHHIANRMKVLAALHTAGARILMGTDAPQQFSVPGFSLHNELLRMGDAGMTPYAIYRTGTVNVGEYFRDQDTFGQVAAGHRADLVLVRSNPLEDVRHIRDRAGVMVRGRWLSAESIEAQLETIARTVGSGG
jgi:imidazolonepropionase-like amidohydrolase